MENTPENKAKFFAQYWGQNVLRIPQFLGGFLKGHCTVKIGSDSRWNFWVEKGFLELKPLYQLTDEDATEVAKISLQVDSGWKVIKRKDGKYGDVHIEREGPVNDIYHVSIQFHTGEVKANHHFLGTDDDKAESFKVNIGKVEMTTKKPVPFYLIVDFLRKRGYAVPFDGVSVKELVEWGWIKFEDK